MQYQHLENYFRRLKGARVMIRSTSGTVTEGGVVEVTNDFIMLEQIDGEGNARRVLITLQSIESVTSDSAA